MPGRNRMGPMGQGPMTGRMMGYCAGDEATLAPGQQDVARPGMGRGHSGRGGGRHGWRHCFHATGLPGWMRLGAGQAETQAPATQDERQYLQGQVELLREKLEHVEHRLNELSKPEPDETR